MKLPKACPACNTEGSLRKILWGMPDGPVDESTYVIGGCIISDEYYECIECGFRK